MTAKSSKKQFTIGFVALGCPKNTVDSERMLAQIARAGLLITHDCDNADVVVINTCAFIAPAKIEALAAVNRAIRQKRKGRVHKVIVAGCLPQRIDQDLFSLAPDIDAIVGLEHRDQIARIIRKTLAADSHLRFVTPAPHSVYDDRVRLRITPPHYAYLRISEGCSRKCSFCTIPAIRGKSRSKPPRLVLDEARRLVDSGARELIIIAQDTTNYGRDLALEDALPRLLTNLAKIPCLAWIRLLYLFPTTITPSLIDTVASNDKILNYFDIPLQHINSHILKLMHRPHDKRRIRSLIEDLRDKIPDCVLRTTLIVGFPGETDSRFSELLDFVNWAKFDHLGCFTFYPEPGTAACELPHQVPDPVKQQRRRQLMLTQQKICFAKNKSRIGSSLSVLIDRVEKRPQHRAIGRFFGQSPDIDSLCYIRNCSAPPGSFVEALVDGPKNYDLLCTQLRFPVELCKTNTKLLL